MDYQHINLDFLEQFARGDKNRMVKYIQMFLKAGPAGIDSMQHHYDAKDWEQLKSAAHSLKPQVGYMGINSLKQIIPRIEEYAREQVNLDEVPELISKVRGICDGAFEELRDAVGKLENS